MLVEHILEQEEGNAPVNDCSETSYEEIAEELDISVFSISGKI